MQTLLLDACHAQNDTPTSSLSVVSSPVTLINAPKALAHRHQIEKGGNQDLSLTLNMFEMSYVWGAILPSRYTSRTPRLALR